MKSKQQLTNTTNSMVVNKKSYKLATWVCFIAYLLLLGYVVFFSSRFGREDHLIYRYNLTLFNEIGRYISLGVRTGYWNLFMLNVVGNIVVFIPLGVFLPKLFAKCRKLLWVGLLSLEVSIIVEVTQLIAKVGCCDVDDLLLNTLGGILGYLVYKVLAGLLHKFRKNKG